MEQALVELANNSTVSINLSQQRLTTAKIKLLSDILANNTSLRTLILEEVGLDATGAKILARALEKHPTIQRLSVEENPLGKEGLEVIINLFANHRHLYRLRAGGTGGTASQRQRLKDLVKEKGKGRKGPSQSNVSESMAETFYDRAWGGTQIMADPVVNLEDGKIYERERLIARKPTFGGENNSRLTPATSLAQQIHIYLKEQPHLWHHAVYIPKAWQQGVLTAIKNGDSESLKYYWRNHPGLVTCVYPWGGGNRSVYTGFLLPKASYEILKIGVKSMVRRGPVLVCHRTRNYFPVCTKGDMHYMS